MKTIIASCLSALTLAACASDPTPRAAGNSWSEGYMQRALSENRYLVLYRMDGSDYRWAYDLALWRAAQIALEHGYPAFEVVSRDSDTDPGARASTSFGVEYDVNYQRSCGLLGCTTYASPTYNTMAINDPGRRPSRVVSLEIVMRSDSAAGSPNLYLASDVIGNLERR